MKKDGTFAQLLESIQAAHQELTAQAGRAVNISLTLRNWLIGQYIEEYERNGVDRAEYGEKWMDKLAEQLDRQGVSRCDRRELYRYRQFYLTYPQIVQALPAQFQQLHIKGIPDCGVADSTMRQAEISPSPVDGKTLISKLSFTHINELITLDNPTQRAFYEAECIRGNWSVRELKRQIGSLYFERSGLSLDKQKLSKLANASAEVETSLNIRDPYIFEFLGLKPAEVMSESHLEEGKIQTFIDAQLRDVTS
ncbi:MAG: hypothetical protein JJU05_16490 [Verrucomicrobia bacterium]|nr:hypothetical protein [Verrucomicrobiota bacterium]MCH8527911.1 DUF1016 N-terminal domain-containing protein [Kiritimatiellia bacterium]